MNYRKYKVNRRNEYQFILKMLSDSDMTVLEQSGHHEAPFLFVVKLPDNSIERLLCYAFSANKYAQKGRPADEHRFQVKYGNEFNVPHQIFISPDREFVTLMFGIHFKENVIIAVDPAMHERTWFSKSIEFKEERIVQIKESGWCGWERSRVVSGRRRIYVDENLQDEVLLGFEPKHFLRYVGFEKLATGMDPGERHLLIDKLNQARDTKKVHPLELELGMAKEEILEMISSAFRLKVAVRGIAAQIHLRDHVIGLRGITDVRVLDEDSKPDLVFKYKGGEDISVECKNILRGSPKLKVDFQKTRASKADPCSRYYRYGQFDILAACLHPKTESWDFRFGLTSVLPPHSKCVERISQNIFVQGDNWSDDLISVLQRRES